MTTSHSHPAGPEFTAVDFLASLTPAELQALAQVSTERTFPRGSRPMREGERADHVMIILGGWTRISVLEDGRDRVITERGPGQLIGEVGALRVSVRSATVTVLDTVRALVIRTGDFASYLGAHQRVLALVESQIDERLTEEPYQWNGSRDAFPLGAPVLPAGAPLAGENCTVVFTDVVGFAALERNDTDRGIVRIAHWEMLRRSLGYLWEKCQFTDQGDGLLLVAPPAIPTTQIMECLHRKLPGELRKHNQAYREPARIRLRMSANVGPVSHDQVGITGESIIRASRLLDAPVLRKAMAAAGTTLGMVVSPFIYDTAIRHADGWTDPDTYELVEVHVKESHTSAWMRLFDVPPPVPDPRGPLATAA